MLKGLANFLSAFAFFGLLTFFWTACGAQSSFFPEVAGESSLGVNALLDPTHFEQSEAQRSL